MDLHADNLHDLTTFFFTFGSEFLDGFAYIESNDAAVNHMSEMSGVMGALLSESHRGEFFAMPDDWVLAEIAKELRKDRKLFDSMKGQFDSDDVLAETEDEHVPHLFGMCFLLNVMDYALTQAEKKNVEDDKGQFFRLDDPIAHSICEEFAATLLKAYRASLLARS